MDSNHEKKDKKGRGNRVTIEDLLVRVFPVTARAASLVARTSRGLVTRYSCPSN